MKTTISAELLGDNLRTIDWDGDKIILTFEHPVHSSRFTLVIDREVLDLVLDSKRQIDAIVQSAPR